MLEALLVGLAALAVAAMVAIGLKLSWASTGGHCTSTLDGSVSRAAKKRRSKSKHTKRTAGDAADCSEFVEPPPKESPPPPPPPPPPPASAEEATAPASQCNIAGGGRWHTQRPTRRPKSGGQSRTRGTPPPPDASAFRSLPTLGFAVVGSTEPILPLMRSGHKTVELRRAGARLSDGSRLAACRPGDRFVGVPLAAHLRYQCMLEVAAPISHHESHGAAWEVHRDSAVPRSLVGLVPLRSAAEAQRFYETSFYGGRALCNEPVIAIPVRVVAWLDS